MNGKPHGWVAALVILIGTGTASAQNAQASYVKDVKPFLRKYCTECHGANAAKAGYKFETFADLTKAGKKGAGVVPSKPDQSVVLKVLAGQGKPMPPKNYAQKPTAAEIAKVRAWIVAGAKDDSKTAFIDPPADVAVILFALLPTEPDVAWSPH
jgi:hypothetical protein